MASFDGYVLIHHKRIKEKMKISKHEDQTCVENGLTEYHKDQKDEYTNHEKSEDKKRSIDLEQLISFEKMMPSKIRFSVDTVNQAFDLDYLHVDIPGNKSEDGADLRERLQKGGHAIGSQFLDTEVADFNESAAGDRGSRLDRAELLMSAIERLEQWELVDLEAEDHKSNRRS